MYKYRRLKDGTLVPIDWNETWPSYKYTCHNCGRPYISMINEYNLKYHFCDPCDEEMRILNIDEIKEEIRNI